MSANAKNSTPTGKVRLDNISREKIVRNVNFMVCRLCKLLFLAETVVLFSILNSRYVREKLCYLLFHFTMFSIWVYLHIYIDVYRSIYVVTFEFKFGN